MTDSTFNAHIAITKKLVKHCGTDDIIYIVATMLKENDEDFNKEKFVEECEKEEK